MWTGTSALNSIDQHLKTIRNDVVRLDSQLAQLTIDMATSRRHRAKLLNDIAAIRLAEIDSGVLDASLSAADSQVEQLLSRRDTALNTLNQEIETINDRLANSEDERAEILTAVNSKSQQIVDVEGEVQKALKDNAAYLEQFIQARDAESVSSEAQRKRLAAESSLSEKAAPYKADNLFMYLWDRSYGTTQYNGGFFARFMDGWVAKVIAYEPARVNYWNLTEIPKRLAEHADRVASVADEQHKQLQSIETEALNAAGIEVLETQLAEEREKLDEHDDALEAIEVRLNDELALRNHFASGTDDFMQQALERLTQALEHQNLSSVYRYVRETVSHTDDLLLVELQSVEDTLDDEQDNLESVRSVHNGQLGKLKDLERVRRDFKNSRFDDVRSGFGNQTLITGVLSQFLQGVVSGPDVWNVLKRNQRYRQVASSPNFGSSALGGLIEGIGVELLRQAGGRGRRRNSSWHFPKPRGDRSGGGGFRMPRGGGRKGGGGFSTGGGF